MPEFALSRIAPVTDAGAARLASPAAFAELATLIVAAEIAATDIVPSEIAATGAMTAEAPGAQPQAAYKCRFRRLLSPLPLGSSRLGTLRLRRHLALLTAFPVALAAVAALLVTVLSPGGDNGANSPAAIKALSFAQQKGTITVVIRNPYADAAWYNADLARHHIPFTLQVIPASPSVVGTLLGGNYAPGVKALTGKRSCYYPGNGSDGPCEIGFTVPVNLKDSGSVWIGGPAKPGQEYGAQGSVFSTGEALAGLLKQVAAQPLSKVRPILARHHLKVEYRDEAGDDVSASSVPDSYYVTNIMPWAAGLVDVWTSPKQAWDGSERVTLPKPSTASLPAPNASS